jgi:hypothetical protein
MHADVYDAKPKLIGVLVFDQFRGDYLPEAGRPLTDCYYDYANLITAAGHSTIETGAYTDGHGVP